MVYSGSLPASRVFFCPDTQIRFMESASSHERQVLRFGGKIAERGKRTSHVRIHMRYKPNKQGRGSG